jgi:hypothetical protein
MSGTKGAGPSADTRSIPMPTTANGFTPAQLAEIRKARERNVRDGLRFVGDYR